jgi:NAD(P)H-dependent FMN reductase
MAGQISLLFFAGSTRRESFNKRLARAARNAAEAKGHKAEFIDLADYPMPIYNGDLEAAEGPPANAARLKALFERHQGIFIASPEYNASITPLLKNTLDWVTRVRPPGERPLQVFASRIWALGSASAGAYGGMRSLIALRQTLSIGMSALVLAEQIAVAGADKALGLDGTVNEARYAQMLDGVVERLADRARRLAA